ncbi:MAG: aminoglycoside phosphotransferase family protein [Pseudomonadota bacterium]
MAGSKHVAPDKAALERLTDALGVCPTDFEPVTGGYTAAARWRARLGRDRVFIKLATTDVTTDMMHRELRAYQALRLPIMPTFIAGSPSSEAPFLVIEDLAHATWPPPWSRHQIEGVLVALEALHATPAPADLPAYHAVNGTPPNGWDTVAEAPEPFLSLGVMSKQELARALPQLRQLASGCSFEGPNVCHWDLRSDNMCLTDRGVVLIDWSEACASNPSSDLGAWLPSLAQEGGPLPESILPNAPEIAAWMAGYFASQAGLPVIPDAPYVRDIQKAQLSTALPWALRAAGVLS